MFRGGLSASAADGVAMRPCTVQEKKKEGEPGCPPPSAAFSDIYQEYKFYKLSRLSFQVSHYIYILDLHIAKRNGENS